MSEMSDSDKKQKYYELQLNILRDELVHLKKCQITFLTAAITITSTIYTITATFSTKSIIYSTDQASIDPLINYLPFYSFPYLIPLLIILPAWSIFFDKARSISRAVGYCRIIEKLMNGATAINFHGWETDLQEFRKQQSSLYDLRKIFLKAKVIHDESVHIVNNSYWLWSYFIFFCLTWLSIIFSVLITYTKYHIVEQWLIIVISLSVCVTYRNFMIYLRFTNAKRINSYNTNTWIWEHIVGLCPMEENTNKTKDTEK